MGKLAEKRKEKNLTQTELAKRVGISQCTLSLYENGKRCPDVKVAKCIAKQLGISIDDIF